MAARIPLLMVNRAATGGGAAGPSSSGQEYYIFDQCEAIDGMEDEAKKSPPTISPSWVTFIMLLLGGLIIFALMYSFLGGIGSDSGASADGTSTSATASSA